MKSLKRFEGVLSIDHRSSPGINDERLAHRVGAKSLGEGTFHEIATLSCCHCRGVMIKNPLRTRPRSFCRSCGEYICDECGAAAASPGYIHRSFSEIADLVRSGRYRIAGGNCHAPLLVPTFTET